MKEKNELSYRDLKMVCNQNMFNFETKNIYRQTTNGTEIENIGLY